MSLVRAKEIKAHTTIARSDGIAHTQSLLPCTLTTPHSAGSTQAYLPVYTTPITHANTRNIYYWGYSVGNTITNDLSTTFIELKAAAVGLGSQQNDDLILHTDDGSGFEYDTSCAKQGWYTFELQMYYRNDLSAQTELEAKMDFTDSSDVVHTTETFQSASTCGIANSYTTSLFVKTLRLDVGDKIKFYARRSSTGGRIDLYRYLGPGVFYEYHGDKV